MTDTLTEEIRKLGQDMSRKLIIKRIRPDWTEIERETADVTGAHFWGCQSDEDVLKAVKAWLAEDEEPGELPEKTDTVIDNLNYHLDTFLAPDWENYFFMGQRICELPEKTARKLAAVLAIKEMRRLQSNVGRRSNASPEARSHTLRAKMEGADL